MTKSPIEQAVEWKPVKGWERHYLVNEFGEIKRISRTNRKDRNSIYLNPWKKGGKPYFIVRLSCPDKRQVEYVHRIVAGAFLDNPHNYNVVNHIDCNPSNNHYLNLEWCTQSENVRHSKNLGRYPDNYWKGKRSPTARLSDEEVDKIRKEYSIGILSHQKLAEKYGCSKRTVGRIVTFKSYPPPPQKENE